MPKVHGKGSIIPLEDKPNARCRHWKIQFYIEPEGEGKKRRYPTRSKRIHGKTYTQAEAARDDFRVELEHEDEEDDPPVTVEGNKTVRECVADWCKGRKESGKIAKRTTTGEENKLKNVVLHLGDIAMKDLTTEDINRAYSLMLQGGPGNTMSGKPLAGTSVFNTHKSFRPLLKKAIKDNAVRPDILEGVMIPKPDTLERVPLTNEQVAAFVHSIEPTNAMAMLVLVCVTCGLRRSEAVALEWRNIGDDQIFVSRAAEEDATPKTVKRRKSNRAIPMPTTTALKLEEWKEHQKNLLAARKVKQGQSTPVFTNKGKPYKPHSVTSWWERHAADFGLSCTLHDLRHTFATMLARESVNQRIASDLVGDETPVLNAVYTHVATEDMKQAIRRLDNIF